MMCLALDPYIKVKPQRRPAYITTPPAAKHKHRLPLALASLSPALLLALSTRTRGRARETSGGRRHAPCSSSRSRRWRPASGGVTATLSAEAATEPLRLHEEGAWASRRARGHGGAASERGAATGQQEDGGGAAVTGEGDDDDHDDDGVPRQLVRQAGHRIPVPEPSRSFGYSSRLSIPAMALPWLRLDLHEPAMLLENCSCFFCSWIHHSCVSFDVLVFGLLAIDRRTVV